MSDELDEFLTGSADAWTYPTADFIFSPTPEPNTAIPPTPIRHRVPLTSSKNKSKSKTNVPRIVENPLATRAPRTVNDPLWTHAVDDDVHPEVRAVSTTPRSPAENYHQGNDFPLVVDTPPFIALTPPQDSETEFYPPLLAETPRFISLSPALSRNSSLTLEGSSNGGFAYLPLRVDTPRFTSMTPSVVSSRHASPETMDPQDATPAQRSSISVASSYEADVESNQEEWEDVPQASSSNEVKKTQKVNKMNVKIPRKVGVKLNAGGFPKQGLKTVRMSTLARESTYDPHKIKMSKSAK
ncbi:hypothetical protein CYLTODRAFT_481519 [Cylindrobasidium torrendii FP15055 ss-10]|uniref:Uncharacterized protein n=1 Tax=Cylindrobasidium torrendii FP15055 ss-10 TaxID=1314674 RepID=A0A0D7BFX7_9AGAR|nr:hypothetical protein CYLTODRAFT_481519 [Cylindrobasidium torrendii FP15055 ss-10]